MNIKLDVQRLKRRKEKGVSLKGLGWQGGPVGGGKEEGGRTEGRVVITHGVNNVSTPCFH